MDGTIESGQRHASLAPLTLADKSLFELALASLSEPISDNSFANIYVWKDASHLAWAVIHNHLCVFANGTGDLTLYEAPLPLEGATDENFRRCLEVCFEIMDDYQTLHCLDTSISRIDYVSDEMLEYISAQRGPWGLELSASPFPGDYVYSRQDMVDLPGGSFKSKRRSKQKFERTWTDHRVEVFQERHIPDCFALLDVWQKRADERKHLQVTEDSAHCPTMDLRQRETQACRRAMLDHKILNLRGMVVYVGDVLVGFTLGEKLGGSQASILFEKTHPDYDGAPQFIFSEFCRVCWEDCTEINAGDDWYIPTLRATKESYRPRRRLCKYTLSRPTNGITLRQATRHDVTRLAEIERACFDPDTAFTKRQIARLVANTRVTNMVAVKDGIVIGWSSSFVRRHAKTTSGRIYNLAVDPACRSMGVGRKLMRFMLRRLELLGAARVYLEVSSVNESAIRLYHSMGFALDHLLPDYYGPAQSGISMCMKFSKDATATVEPAAQVEISLPVWSSYEELPQQQAVYAS